MPALLPRGTGAWRPGDDRSGPGRAAGAGPGAAGRETDSADGSRRGKSRRIQENGVFTQQSPLGPADVQEKRNEGLTDRLGGRHEDHCPGAVPAGP